MFQTDAGLQRYEELGVSWSDDPASKGFDETKLKRWLSLKQQANVESLSNYRDGQVMFITSSVRACGVGFQQRLRVFARATDSFGG